MSIRFKLILVVAAGLGLLSLSAVWSIDRTSRQNLDGYAQQALRVAAEAFDNLCRREVSKMTAVSEMVIEDERLAAAFEKRDTQAIYAQTAPRYRQLREHYDVTHWNFLTPEPDHRIVARLSKPQSVGDRIERVALTQAAETRAPSSGLELGKTGFALRVVRPWLVEGRLLGYVEFGEELGPLVRTLREQTGCDIAVHLLKTHLSATDWASTRSALGLRSDWDRQPDRVLAEATISDERLTAYGGDIEGLPPGGKVLETIAYGHAIYLRGVFALRDATGRPLGAVVVLKDITDISNALVAGRNNTTGMILVFAFLIAAVVVVMLDRLVFVRLRRMLAQLELASLRLAGGDFDLHVEPTGQTRDEIGAFESFLAKFLALIAETLKAMSTGTS